MSYEIEKGKRVLFVPAGTDERFTRTFDAAFFLVAASSNNVSPRTYGWNVIAWDSLTDWGGEIQLPAKLWQYAGEADGGSIKPYGRDVSGIAYIKAWKDAARKRRPVFDADGNPLWQPNVSIWVGGYSDGAERAKEINDKGAELFGKYDSIRPELFSAFKSLFPEPLRGGPNRAYPRSRAEVLNALYLYVNRDQLPFSLHLVNDAECAYLRAAPGELIAA